MNSDGWHKPDGVENTLQSECGNYRITNQGPKKGNKYCLWKRREGVYNHEVTGQRTDSWCEFITIGTASHCRRSAK